MPPLLTIEDVFDVPTFGGLVVAPGPLIAEGPARPEGPVLLRLPDGHVEDAANLPDPALRSDTGRAS
jgi:hypothetical protein